MRLCLYSKTRKRKIPCLLLCPLRISQRPQLTLSGCEPEVRTVVAMKDSSPLLSTTPLESCGALPFLGSSPSVVASDGPVCVHPFPVTWCLVSSPRKCTQATLTTLQGKQLDLHMSKAFKLVEVIIQRYMNLH